MTDHPIRENPEQYMQELRNWLQQTEDVPLEDMDAFFTQRVGMYEEHMSRWAPAYQALAALVPEGTATLLDLGCGTGLELDELFVRFPDLEVTGIDLSAAMLTQLRGKHPNRRLTLCCADYFQADWPKEAFDTAVSFETLHHFSPDRKRDLFCKILKGLRPGGTYLEGDYLACCDEEEQMLAQAAVERRKRQGIAPEVFVHFDTPLTVRREMQLMREAGFASVDMVDCIEGACILRAVRPRTLGSP